MLTTRKHFTSVEPLEARIAPAAVFPTIADAERDPLGSHFKSTTVGTPILLGAGDILTTGTGAKSGSYLLFVEKGQALVFTSDLNNNNQVDFNEITGIAAGDGLRMVSFVDIHGDIVTNLKSNATLTDADNNSGNDDTGLKGDGRTLLNNRIEKVELRSLRVTDLTDQNGDNVVDFTDISLRMVLSSYSIFGQIIAGGGFGVPTDDTSGLIIDDTGKVLQAQFFTGPGSPFNPDYYDPAVTPIKSMVGGIVVGTAASGEYFSFGINRNTINDPLGTGDVNGRDLLANGNDVQGYIRTFTPASGTTGAGISYVRGATPNITFNIGRLAAGDGGLHAPGGSISNVTLNGDDAGGYVVTAGNGGGGSGGGVGGSILLFEDLGSNTSEVVIHAGTGGNGSTGAGGAGGSAGFGTMNILGSVLIQEGDGGNGFTTGGNGASLGKATVTSPDRLEDYARNIVGTTHDSLHSPLTGKRIILDPIRPGTIGQGNAVDFDGDGIGDIVFTSSDPSQLVVQFGDGNGGFRIDPNTGLYDRIYLDGPLDAEALTIGDFDGDGHYDIATGSTRGGSHAGVFVFLSKYEDTNQDGVLTKSEDLNGNGRDDLLGFRAPRFSALPNLNDAAGFGLTVERSGHAIADIEAGDFNGDGFTDLAVVATYYSNVTLQPRQYLLFMYPDVEDAKPTGQFYVDFGTKAQAVPPQSANPFLSVAQIAAAGDTTANIEVTALSVFAGHDVVIALADSGARGRALQVLDNSVPTFFGPSVTQIPLGRVDTNRDLPNGTNANISLTGVDVNGADFTIIDFNQDGLADYVATIEIPAGFLVVLEGDGLGGGRRVDFPYTGNQNAGFFLGPPTNGNGGANITTAPLAIVGVDADGDGLRDEVAIYYQGVLSFSVAELEIGYPPAAGLLPAVGVDDNPGADLFSRFTIGTFTPQSSVVAFDVYYPFSTSGGVPDTKIVNYAIGDPEIGDFVDNVIYGTGDFGFDFTLTSEHYFRIEAGDGGNGLIGKGGNGGNLGAGAIDPTTFVGTLDIRIVLGDVQFVGGHGGNGFSSGGKGGSVIGVVLSGSGTSAQASYLNCEILAGDGGLAVSGIGGAGGDIIGPSVFAGGVLTAGNGGRGLTGGSGGSIIGNGIQGLYDTQDLFQQLTAGTGGNGIKRGGNGGSILNFHSSVDLNAIQETGTLIYLAGNGGTAVSGTGGNGGSVVNTSPLDEDRNQLAGDIYLAGGRGGDGRTGGNGGTVDTFINSTDQFQVPAIVSFLGGDGGNSTKGPAGIGGSVKNIATASTGTPNPFSFSATAFTFSRVIAGRGGDSSGNNGGNGGGVSGINITAQNNPLAVVSGAGGDGLFRGGNGGSVLDSIVQIGNSSFAKAVIISGDGGDATAYLANAFDPASLQTAVKAFGGKVGRGGNGGGISGIRQLGGVLTRMDLIAGNGGDTVNYGTIADLSSFVGKGGSISNVVADGIIGNFDSQVPIKSYNDIRGGETMDDFVRHSLRDESSPGSVSDTVGNVGIVTGAAGRVKAVFNGYDNANQPIFPSTPAVGGVNGSLTSITARGIMSAVAGSVERIAAIQSVKDIKLTGSGSIGADKPGDVRFLTKDLTPTPSPVLDGVLIDGALVCRSRPTNLAGQSVNLGADVYILA